MASISYRSRQGADLTDRFTPGTLIELWARNTNEELRYLVIGLNEVQPPSSSRLWIGRTTDGGLVNIHLLPEEEVYVVVSYPKR